MLVNAYIEVQSMCSGPKKMSHIEMYVETENKTNEPFFTLSGKYADQNYTILVTKDRNKAKSNFDMLFEKLIDKQLEEAAERQKNNA